MLLGSSGATFDGPTTVGTGVDPISVAVGEFNQDGDPDLAVAEESGQVRVLLGGSGGGFTGPTAVLSGSQAEGVLSSVAVGDFNRDGDPDLAVAHRSGNQVRVLLGGPGGSFGSPTNVPTGTLPASVAVADFNADGKPDLATAHPTTNTVSVLLNTTVTNRAPTAAADAYSTAEDTTLTVAAPGVLANDSDPDGDPLSAVLVSGPSHGTLTLNPDGSFTYTPAANYNGTDSFTYQASDGTLTSNLATVTITVSAVNDAPTVTVAAGGTCGTNDRSGTINLTVGDVDSAATALTLSASSSNPTLVPNGNVVLGGSGATRTLTATAVAGRTGTAILTVTVSDGQATGSVAGHGHGSAATATTRCTGERRHRPDLRPERQRHAHWRGQLRPAVRRQRQRHPVRRRGRRQPGRRRWQRPAHRRAGRRPLQRRRRHRHGDRLRRRRGRHQRRHDPLATDSGRVATARRARRSAGARDRVASLGSHSARMSG